MTRAKYLFVFIGLLSISASGESGEGFQHAHTFMAADEHPEKLAELVEIFDIGRDTGTQVSTMYRDPFPYTGRLDRVIFTVSDENTVPPRKLPAAYY